MSRRRRRPRRQQAAPPPQLSRWKRARRSLDSFGGILVVGTVIATVVVLVVVVIVYGPSSPSDEELLGEAVQEGAAVHVADPSSLPSLPLPATGGPHAASPQRTGTYSEPIGDGNAIHAMEHGIVWITYQPDLLTEDEIERLEDVAGDFRRDTIIAPRPQNTDPIVLVSWGRRLVMATLDEDLVAEFIQTNRDRSPEPGIR